MFKNLVIEVSGENVVTVYAVDGEFETVIYVTEATPALHAAEILSELFEEMFNSEVDIIEID